MNEIATTLPSTLILKSKRISFPAIAVPKAIGEGAPAYGARFIIDPNDPDVKALDDLIVKVANDKWKEEGPDVLAFIKQERKICFQHAPYRSSNTGKVWPGFEGKFNLGTRSEKTKPTVFTASGDEITGQQSAIEQLIYAGCYVHAKIEIWAQDNTYGRRINATLLGVVFDKHGDSFGGGSAPARPEDFGGLIKRPDAEDLL